MTFENLPTECQSCIYLHCWSVSMDNNNSYNCKKIPCFLKYKKDNCKEYREDLKYET